MFLHQQRVVSANCFTKCFLSDVLSHSKLLVREQADKKAAVEAQGRVEKEANELRARYSGAKTEAESQQKVI